MTVWSPSPAISVGAPRGPQNGELAAASGRAADGDLAAMGAHDRPREAQAETVPLRRAAGVGAIETFEHPRQGFRVDADARVGDRERDATVRGSHRDVDGAAAVGVLDGVVDEVGDHTLYARHITTHRRRAVGRPEPQATALVL